VRTSATPGQTSGASGLARQPWDGSLVLAGNGTVGDSNAPPDFALVRILSSGALDKTFGSGGIVLTDFQGQGAFAHAVLALPSGNSVCPSDAYDKNRIIAAGFVFLPTVSAGALAAYDMKGALSTSFGSGGKVTTTFGNDVDTGYNALALDASGRIVAAGYSGLTATTHDFIVARYTSTGTLDTSFNGTGFVRLSIVQGNDNVATGVVVQGDGKIVVGGSTAQLNPTVQGDLALARVNDDGSIDTTFGSSGRVVLPAGAAFPVSRLTALALQPDGRIVGGGSADDSSDNLSVLLARFNGDGSPDPSFGVGGLSITKFEPGVSEAADSLAIGADGTFFVAGYNPDGFVAHLSSTGSKIPAFGQGGYEVVHTDPGDPMGQTDLMGIVLEPNGAIRAAGYVGDMAGEDFVAVGLKPSGGFDPTFGQ
jgi:uncharacterized delta-60 repeat protein